MKIADSTIHLNANHTSVEQHEIRESLTIWKDGGEVQSFNGPGNRDNELELMQLQSVTDGDKVTLSPEVLQRRTVENAVEPALPQEDVIADLNIRILKELIERFTGKKIQLAKPVGEKQPLGQEDVPTEKEVIEAGSGVGFAYDFHESHYEYENTQFKGEGTILTQDGKEINFSLELNMSREFYTEQNINIRAGEALKDPLIINFGGSAAELSQTQFAFDIDADGHEDQIAFVSPASGFLALDKNGDTLINDGSELFGAMTGDGFAELAAYDEDGNNWLDENDSVYDRLRIWSKTENGEDRLVSLGQKGMGAIYLGNMETPFSIKNNENQLLGQVRSTGFYLYESGMSGSVQQVDLVV